MCFVSTIFSSSKYIFPLVHSSPFITIALYRFVVIGFSSSYVLFLFILHRYEIYYPLYIFLLIYFTQYGIFQYCPPVSFTYIRQECRYVKSSFSLSSLWVLQFFQYIFCGKQCCIDSFIPVKLVLCYLHCKLGIEVLIIQQIYLFLRLSIILSIETKTFILICQFPFSSQSHFYQSFVTEVISTGVMLFHYIFI